ncbi:MAG: thiamine-phosphate kinase [Bacteroidales bacterium]|nr:thiamine-phosphate kinase [Bacteroidales bacterium]
MDTKTVKSISELGEFGLISYLTDNIVLKNSSTIKGIGDDAAVLSYPADRRIVVTTDLLTEGIHFNLLYVPLLHLGYKAVMVNLSDVFAMNARPRQITVSIALSSRFDTPAVSELYEGIRMACDKHGVDIVGGDTSSSRSGLHISITAIGEADKDKLVYRDGANVNDLICVSGDLGGAYMGLQLLEREKEVLKANPVGKPQLDGYSYILQRQLKPEARGDIITLLDALGIRPSSMLDISDGLSSELLHICKASNVGCSIYEEKIPMDSQTKQFAQELNINPLVAALNGGEDYELLFTVPLADYEKIKNDPDITIIGHITPPDKGANLITALGGTPIPLQAQGWRHL